MKQFKLNTLLILLTLLLVQCTAKWHIKKAVKKDPSIQTEIVDTLKLTKIYFDTIRTSDSTFYIEQRFVYYDTIIKYSKIQADFSDMKTWWETLQDSKTERKQIKNDRKKDQTQIKNDSKTDRVEIRQDARAERGRSWWWLWLAIGIILGIITHKAQMTTGITK